MDPIALSLTVVTVLVGAAIIWFFIAAFRVAWWWVPLFFLVLPQFVFMVRYRSKLKGPGLLLASAMILMFGTLIASGDLVRERHPDEQGRTVMQRAFGCSGAPIWQQMRTSKDTPLETLLRDFPVDTTAPATDLDAARVAVYTSALSYLSAEEIEQLTKAAAPAVRTIAVTAADHQAVVRVTDDVVVVAFRGTDNAQNWIANFKFIPVSTDLGMVHAGFRDGYEAVAPRIREILETERIRSQPVWLAGHSLGGAMAMLAALDLRKININAAGVVTFGQPPAGYGAFANAWEAMAPGRLVRYVNHVDAVAKIIGPIASSSMALTHTGRVHYFDTSGRLHVSGVPAIQGIRDGVCAPAFESGAEFGAHYIRRYVTLVRLAAGK